MTLGSDSFLGADDVQYEMPTGDTAGDVIYAGAGSDYVAGSHGNDIIYGGDGNDTLLGNEGDDILIGGKNDDTFWGGTGNDTYVYNLGDGIDTIYHNKGENNVVRLGAGVNKDNVTLHLGSLMLDLGNGDAIHIGDFDRNDVFNSSSITSFEFADGSSLTTAELLARGFDIDGTEKDDVDSTNPDTGVITYNALRGTNTTNRINGLGGNDVIYGNDGNDTLNGGDGNDQLAGDDGGGQFSGNDTLNGDAGNDTLWGNGGDDILNGGADSDMLGGGDGTRWRTRAAVNSSEAANDESTNAWRTAA